MKVDASKIIITGNAAVLFASGYVPTTAKAYVGTVLVRRASLSSPWKVRISG